MQRGLRYKPRDQAAYIAARDRYRMDDPRQQLDAARKRYHQARKGLEEAQDAAGHFTRRHDIPHENIALREVGAALEQLSIACERCKAEGL